MYGPRSASLATLLVIVATAVSARAQDPPPLPPVYQQTPAQEGASGTFETAPHMGSPLNAPEPIRPTTPTTETPPAVEVPPTAPTVEVSPPAPDVEVPVTAPTIETAPPVSPMQAPANAPTATARAAGAQDRPAINQGALSALDRMATFLRSLQDVEVAGETTTDDFLASGQKVQYGGTVKLRIHRPDRMAAEVVTDRKNEQMFYDGTTFTVYQPKIAYYASFAAPPDLRGLVNVLEQRYGIDLPLADLFRWGTDTAQIAAIQRATYLGKSTIKGKPCSHYAFRQSDIDWEVWIQDGEQPLPRKLLITTTSEKTQPQHSSVMTWNLDPKPDPLAFTFTPPPNAQRISFETAGPRPPTRQARPAPQRRRGPTP